MSMQGIFLWLLVGSSLCSAKDIIEPHATVIPASRTSRLADVAHRIRGGFDFLGGGGGGSFNPNNNPNYAPTPSLHQANPTTKPMRLGDLDKPVPSSDITIETLAFSEASSFKSQRPSLVESVHQYLLRLRRKAPSVWATLISCVSVFCLWQIPSFHKLLQHHFVCSRTNLLFRNSRIPKLHTLLLSAISHSTPLHLFFNIAALLTFGPSVRYALDSTSRWTLAPLLVGSAFSGSLLYLMTTRGGGGCMGLSGVTLSLLAVYSRLFPDRNLGMLVGIVPVRMPASYLLQIMMAWSLIGTLVSMGGGSLGGGSVAHATHLGGLLFGTAYYELWVRRYRGLYRWRNHTMQLLQKVGLRK